MKLIFDGGEFTLGGGVTTVGRTSDNDVSFPGDSNVSRNHAEIEERGGEYCLIDLNSSNGTTVNGSKVSGETYLQPGDVIVLGGSSRLTFAAPAADPLAAEEPESPETSGPALNLPNMGGGSIAPPLTPAAPEAGSRTMLMVAGGAVLVAVLVVGVAGAIYYRSVTSVCGAKAKIVKPEPGETIYAATEIEVETEDSQCVAKAVFTLDGVEFASAEDAPYTATLDPKDHPDMADGFDHSLGIFLVDEDGNRIPQTGDVLLAMETRKVQKPEEKPETPEQPTGQPQLPAGQKGKEVSLIDVQEMTVRLAKQLAGGQRYNVSNKQFLQEVQKRSAEYVQEGYYDRATRFRDAVNVAFVREQNLDPALGYLLAMSRSKFDPQKQGADEGLWRMNPAFAKENGYDGLCGGQPLGEPTQNCSAKAAAVYMKAMVFGVFDGDAVLSAVSFGRSTADATAWKASLPASRTDLWNAIKTAPEREQLVRLFAAGIVADNPQKFGLKRDKPISTLYP